MQVTIEIPDTVAAKAAQQGLSPETYVKSLIDSAEQKEFGASSFKKRDLALLLSELGQTERLLPVLSDDDLRRESLYTDHD